MNATGHPPQETDERPGQVTNLIERAKSTIYQHPDSALIFLREATTLAEQAQLEKQLAESMSWTGVAHYIKAEYDLALPLFTDALEKYRKLDDHHGLASSYNHIGLIYQTQGRYDQAIAYHRKGANHGKAIGNIDRQASNYFNIGLAYDEIGKYDSALHYLNICRNQSAEAGFDRLLIMALNRTAKVNFHLGKLIAAQELYDSALAYPTGKNNWEKCFALAGLAEVYDARGLHERAIAYGQESFDLAKAINAKWDVIHAAEILSGAHAHHGNFQKAYEMSLIVQAYKDSVFSEEKENKLNYIHLKENELANANLERKNALQTMMLKQKNTETIIAFVIAASLLVILLVLFSRHRQENRLNKQLILTNRQIEQQNKDLNELNNSKIQLLSIISHDLRSPFSNLQGLLMLSRTGNLSENEQRELFARVEEAFSSVSDTLESLLHWAQSQMDEVGSTPETLNLDKIIEDTNTFWEPFIRKKEIDFRFERRGYEMYADPYHLKTIIRNIVGNAVKFTKPSGTVAIDSVRRHDKVGIIISDTGVGMPAVIRDSLFSTQSQKENQRPGTLMEKGSGLGLMISLQLLEKNGGTIEVESEEGRGSTFTVWLPSANFGKD